MKLQVLVAAVNKDARERYAHMGLTTDAVFANQCGTYGYEAFDVNGNRVQVFSMDAKGVGLNRNTALMNAAGDLVLFADDDIVYEKDYAQIVEQAFAEHPEADMILFNVQAAPGRETYHNTEYRQVHWYNYGRYPTYSIAARLKSLRRAGVSFSHLFGGGSPYGSGEDSLFLHDCLKAGLKIYSHPAVIGGEVAREGNASTWFSGYNEKYFYDKGILYHFLYGVMAKPLSLAILVRHRKKLCSELSFGQVYSHMARGIKEGRNA